MAEAWSRQEAAQDELGRVGLALGNAVIAAVDGRNTAYAGRTVGDFKRALERLCSDDEVLGSIEFGVGQSPTGYLVLERVNGVCEFREVPR